jgi:uncharacterized protein (DUF362 family)
MAAAAGGYRLFRPGDALAGPNRTPRRAETQGFTAGAGGDGKTDAAPALTVARNGPPRQLVDAAIEALGGMNRFVSRGDRVLVKPNIGWDRTPQLAANTNPEVVGRLVELCLEAGAKRVTVMDRTCNDARRCYANSGIEAAARKAGARVVHADTDRVKKVNLGGEILKTWKVFDEVLEADVRINAPVAKHHGLARVSLGMKNWMGCVGGDRGRMHQDIQMSVTDLAAWFKPALTVVDAYRIMVDNGPSGGRIEDVRLAETLCAGTDPVAVDAFGASLFGIAPDKLRALAHAEKRGLGKRDLRRVAMREIDLRGAPDRGPADGV